MSAPSVSRRWPGRHAVVCIVAVVLMATGCGPATDDARTSESVGPPTVSATPSTGTTEAEEDLAPPTSEPEPSQEEIWLIAYEATEDAYLDAAAAALGSRAVPGLGPEQPVASCELLEKELPIGARTSSAAEDLALRRTLTAAQVFDVISAATTYVCPELLARHESQVVAFERAERVAARQAARQERRQRARERREAAQAPPPTFYANCTEVENAGAAPIYVGDPGYSTDLDRDGDGIACEQ